MYLRIHVTIWFIGCFTEHIRRRDQYRGLAGHQSKDQAGSIAKGVQSLPNTEGFASVTNSNCRFINTKLNSNLIGDQTALSSSVTVNAVLLKLTYITVATLVKNEQKFQGNVNQGWDPMQDDIVHLPQVAIKSAKMWNKKDDRAVEDPLWALCYMIWSWKMKIF